MFDLSSLNKELLRLKTRSENPKIWNDENAKEIFKKISLIEKKIEEFNYIEKNLSDLEELISFIDSNKDDELLNDIFNDSKKLLKLSTRARYENLLNEEADINNTFIEIHAGAGGTESQDWAEMLKRMYVRWADHKNFKINLLQETRGEEAGIKSTTIKITGEYAYGWLKNESGIHRLVRISPFDSNKKRHTSFASIWVYPEIDEKIKIEINEIDLRIDTYRSSGAGGQHVNTTDSAVRITHIPSKIVVQCQSDRSQHKNKANALSMLKSRLYKLELQKRKEKDSKTHSTKKDIGWGNQIRSYVLHPYRLIKDLRTNHETSNVLNVLDGKIDRFLELSLTQ